MAGRSSRGAAGRAPREGAPKPKLSALDAGIRLLARRPYGGVELGRRLLRLRHEEGEVKTALDNLVELGYLDDATFADLHVTRRAGKRGPRALSAELAGKGVDRETVRAAVARFDPDAQLRLAARVVRRDVGSNLPPTYQELVKKQGARLLRRGYSHSIALAACRAVWTGNDERLVDA